MENEPISQAHHKTKRNRGGQKGNQNARKHGFYSAALSPAEICQFWNITNLEGIDPQVAVLRIKLQSFLRRDPGNRRVLMEALKLLVKWYRARYRLDETNTACLKTVVWSWFESYLGRLDNTDRGIENI